MIRLSWGGGGGGGGGFSSEKVGFVDVVDTREGLLAFGASFLSREDSFEVSRVLSGWCLKLELRDVNSS